MTHPNKDSLREELYKKLGKYKVIGDTTFGLGYKEANELIDDIEALLTSYIEEAERKTDKIADKLVEKRYQLRIEHNHQTMQWYAYYAGRGQRRLFDEDEDWDTAGDTPTEALQKLEQLNSKKDKPE